MGLFSKKQKEDPENLEEILKQFNELKADFKTISGELAEMKRINKFAIQKLGIVRFNPFREVGGDQSFSIAMLDDENNGAVITSYYSREDNRIYGKPVRAGVSDYPLSQEEMMAIEAAKNRQAPISLNNNGKNGKKKTNGK